MNGDAQGRRYRPISVIGVVDVFRPDAEEKDDNLPSVSCYSQEFRPISRLKL